MIPCETSRIRMDSKYSMLKRSFPLSLILIRLHSIVQSLVPKIVLPTFREDIRYNLMKLAQETTFLFTSCLSSPISPSLFIPYIESF